MKDYVTVSVRLPAKLAQAAERIAEKETISLAAVARRALARDVAKEAVVSDDR